MSTGLSRYTEDRIQGRADPLRQAFYRILKSEEFNIAITYGPNDAVKVNKRFRLAQEAFEEVLGAH